MSDVEDTDAYVRFAAGLPLAQSNAIIELCEEVDRLRELLRQVQGLAEGMSDHGIEDETRDFGDDILRILGVDPPRAERAQVYKMPLDWEPRETRD